MTDNELMKNLIVAIAKQVIGKKPGHLNKDLRNILRLLATYNVVGVSSDGTYQPYGEWEKEFNHG
jgi:hypothetical protein